MIQTLRTDQIGLDDVTQMRQGVSHETVREYAEAMEQGAEFPPVIVYFDGRRHWLADGFHRARAHRFLSLPDIKADVREGTQRDAILHAVGANASHGLRRTNADKRRAVEALLKDEEWSKWSDREIARHVLVGNKLVGDVRRAICHPMTGKAICVPNTDSQVDSSGGNRQAQEQRTVQRGGTVFTQNTTNIGQRPAAPTPPPTVERLPPRPPAPAIEQRPSPARPQPVITLQQDDEFGPIHHTPGTTYLPPLPEPEQQAAPEREPYIPFNDPPPPEVPFDPLNPPKELENLHRALERLLKFDREGRHLLANPTAEVLGIRTLARHAREMLGEWLDKTSEQAARTITVDALN
ncbi:ParB/RepB/Spo0J family partition protein [Deinococcus sp. A31D244]|uniref:ParB/RepB/Spo0J family partition protein n=1 Tax=Deinococcus sp. A31D244 TaxID=3397675 RepID=UPI0039DF3258